MKKLKVSNNVKIGISIAVIILILLFCIGYSPENTPIEDVKAGFDKIFSAGGGGGAAPVDLPPETPPSTSWDQEQYSNNGETTEDFGLSEDYISLTGIPTFTEGGTDVQILFYNVWAPDNDYPGYETCTPCDPGVIWCVHDSTGKQIYHIEEKSPPIYDETKHLSGTWDGIHPWKVFFGNNCNCPVYFNYRLNIYWKI